MVYNCLSASRAVIGQCSRTSSGRRRSCPRRRCHPPVPATLQPDYLKPLDSNFVGQYENLKTLETLSRPFVVVASTDEQRIYRCACGGAAAATAVPSTTERALPSAMLRPGLAASHSACRSNALTGCCTPQVWQLLSEHPSGYSHVSCHENLPAQVRLPPAATPKQHCTTLAHWLLQPRFIAAA